MCPILGPLVPLFWISNDVSSGFQSQSGLPYSHCGGKHNVRSLRSNSGATHADLLAAGLPPVLSPHTVTEVRLPGIGRKGSFWGHLEEVQRSCSFWSTFSVSGSCSSPLAPEEETMEEQQPTGGRECRSKWARPSVPPLDFTKFANSESLVNF